MKLAYDAGASDEEGYTQDHLRNFSCEYMLVRYMRRDARHVEDYLQGIVR